MASATSKSRFAEFLAVTVPASNVIYNEIYYLNISTKSTASGAAISVRHLCDNRRARPLYRQRHSQRRPEKVGSFISRFKFCTFARENYQLLLKQHGCTTVVINPNE